MKKAIRLIYQLFKMIFSTAIPLIILAFIVLFGYIEARNYHIVHPQKARTKISRNHHVIHPHKVRTEQPRKINKVEAKYIKNATKYPITIIKQAHNHEKLDDTKTSQKVTDVVKHNKNTNGHETKMRILIKLPNGKQSHVNTRNKKTIKRISKLVATKR